MSEEKINRRKFIDRTIKIVAVCLYMSVAVLSELLAADFAQVKPKQLDLKPTNPQVIKPYINLTEPNGGEKWQYNRYKDIRWRSFRMGCNLRIQLYRFGNYIGQIGQLHSTNNRYRWIVGGAPALIDPALCGDGFQIYLLCGFENPPEYLEHSDHYFSIGMVEITAPGGETWHLGMFKDITWAITGISGNALLELLNGWSGERVGGIAVVPINAGRYRWHIGSYIGGMLPSNYYGAHYKIKISTTDGIFSATSPRFIIDP